jgi:hypothetical protein
MLSEGEIGSESGPIWMGFARSDRSHSQSKPLRVLHRNGYKTHRYGEGMIRCFIIGAEGRSPFGSLSPSLSL